MKYFKAVVVGAGLYAAFALGTFFSPLSPPILRVVYAPPLPKGEWLWVPSGITKGPGYFALLCDNPDGCITTSNWVVWETVIDHTGRPGKKVQP